MLKSEADIPEGAVRPKRDRGYHLAQCQAFAISRRRGTAVAMLKEDNWCWGPLIAYGLVEKSLADNYAELTKDVKNLPCLEYGRYAGIVSAPLSTANFEPDIAVIYSNTAQLNSMLHALTYREEGLVNTPIYPVASCALSVVPALSGEYCVTLPDPGEFGRALASEDEIIFSVPRNKIGELVAQLRTFEKRKMGYRYSPFMEISGDFPRPDFYKRLYRECGLDADDVPTWTLPS
jgi:uncharacterized protein (DUF169 family)